MGNKTQAAFASLIGVSAVTIKKIEQGDLDMSLPMSMRIMGVTGANPNVIRDPKGKAKDVWGDPYDANSYFAYRNSSFGKAGGPDFEQSDIYKGLLNQMVCQMNWLAQAAAQRNRLFAFQFAWLNWIYQVTSDFDLLESFLERSSISCEDDPLFAHLKIAAVSSTKAQIQRERDLVLIRRHQRVKEFKLPPAPPSPSPLPPAKFSKTPRQPSASPKPGSGKTKSTSRPGAPSRKQ